MKLKNQLRLYFIAWLIASAVAVIATRAEADEEHDDHDNGSRNVTVDSITDVSAQTEVGIDQNLQFDSNAYVMGSHSLGDVDINEGQNCWGSEQWGSFIVSRQTNELNPWCASLFYELNGKHAFAAKLRCEIKEIGRHYASEDECVRDQDLTPETPDHDIHSRSVEYQEAYGVVQTAQIDLEHRIEQLEQRPAPRPRIIQQAEPELSEQEKLYILSLLSSGDEE